MSRRLGIVVLLSCLGLLVGSCGSGGSSSLSPDMRASPETFSFLADVIVNGHVNLVRVSSTNAIVKKETIAINLLAAPLVDLGSKVLVRVPGGAGCPGQVVLEPGGSFFSTTESTTNSLGIVGFSGDVGLGVTSFCPIANPMNPIYGYVFTNESGKVIGSLGAGSFLPVAFGGVGHNLILGWEKSGAGVAQFFERRLNGTTLGIATEILPTRGCIFDGFPTFVPDSNEALIPAKCSSNVRQIAIESISPFAKVAKLNLFVTLPSVCKAATGSVRLSDDPNNGLLVSTVANFGNFHQAGWVELVPQKGAAKLVSSNMFNAIWSA